MDAREQPLRPLHTVHPERPPWMEEVLKMQEQFSAIKNPGHLLK